MSKLCNKRLLSASLLEWTLASETTFIEAKENEELIKLAQKYEIVLPSPDLALFKTIYAEIDKVNRNGVILPKKAVEEGLPTIRAKQINWSHEGAHQICGHILDSKIENNKIIVYGVLFKSLFREEFDTVEKLFAEKKLFVSYEIWNRDTKGNSVVKNLKNGYKEINPIIFHGCGMLLLDNQTGEPIPPACPNAMVLQLASKKVIEETAILAEKIVEKEDNFVYAKLVKEEPICTNCKKCKCNEEGGKENIMAEEIKIEEILDNDYEGGEIDEAKKLTTEQRNALPDSDFALIQEKDGKKIRRFPINDEAHVRNALARLPQAKDISEEEKKSALAKILKKAKELNMDELLKKYEKSEEVIPAVKVEEPIIEEPKVEATVVEPIIEPAIVETVTIAEPIIEEKPVEATTEVKVEEIKIEEIQVKEVIIEETQAAEVKPEEVEKTTPEETKVEAEVKPEIVAEVVKEEIVEVKFTQAEVDAKLAEKEIEITNLKKELDSKNQEIAELKTPKVEIAKVEEKPELVVGDASTKTIDKYKERRKKINKAAYGHDSNGN